MRGTRNSPVCCGDPDEVSPHCSADTIFRRKGQGSDFPVLQCAAIDVQALEFRIAQGRAGQYASSLDGSGLIVARSSSRPA